MAVAALRVLIRALLAVGLWSASCFPVFAEDLGALRVTVTDAVTRAPVPLTQVDLYGARSLRGATGMDGVVVFEGLPPGDYQVVVRNSRYIAQTLRGIAVVSARPAELAVPLQRAPRATPSWLRQIGRIGAKAKPKASTTQTTSESPEAKLSGSMVEALGTLPAASIQSSGPSAYLSLGGHAVNQTGISIEGVPVGALGGATNLRPFSLDLFNAVSINRNSPNGTAGGSVNFDTRNPTLDWIGTGNAVQGSYGNAGTTFTEAGTSGRLGLSAAHAARSEGNSLDGLRFADSSGLDYVHRTLARTSGDALKVRYPFSLNNVVIGSLVSLRSDVPLFCSQFTGPVPCGYGPLNEQRSTLTSAQLRDLVSVGRLSAAVSVFHNASTLDIDQSGRFVRGINLPQRGNEAVLANGVIAEGELQVGKGYPLGFSVTNSSQTARSTGSVFGTLVPPSVSSLTFTNASLTGPLLKRRHVTSSLTVGFQHEGEQSHATGQLSLAYSPTSFDSFTFESGAGFVAAQPGSFTGIADPPSLQINCAAGNAVGLGPSSGSKDASSARTSLVWNHTGSKISATVTARHELDFNVPISGLVSATALDPGLFSAGYLAGLRQNYAATCGSAAVPPGLANLFYTVTAAVPYAAYDSGEVSMHVDASRNVALDFSYGAFLARASGGSGALFAPGSTVSAGAQLPNRPMHTANAAIAAAIGRSGAKALANVHYVSANNPNNLPSYVVVDAGFEFKLQRGTVASLSLLNLTNAYGGTFATTAGAVPLATQTGAFRTVATPLAPHSVNVALRIPVGPGSQLEDVPNRDPGPTAYGFMLRPYPDAPPQDPFAIDRRSGRCGPEAAPRADHYLGLIRDYVRRIEAARSPDGAYPAAFPERDVEGLRLHYRRTAASYAVLVALDKNLSFAERLPVAKPVMGCAHFYSGLLPETRKRGLYISPYDEQEAVVPMFDFAPSVGFYVPPSLIENSSMFPDYAELPAAAPADPFAIASGEACPPYVRSSAEAFVALLRPYVAAYYNGEKPRSPEGFEIVPHASGGQTWLEILSADVNIQLLASCLRIAAVDRDTLLKMKLDGARSPSLDYTPRLGFYQVW